MAVEDHHKGGLKLSEYPKDDPFSIDTCLCHAALLLQVAHTVNIFNQEGRLSSAEAKVQHIF